jgi:hypothetical protein
MQQRSEELWKSSPSGRPIEDRDENPCYFRSRESHICFQQMWGTNVYFVVLSLPCFANCGC